MQITKVVSLAILLTSSGNIFANLTSDQAAAKDKGIELYNQYKVAEPELRIAATAGDSEAQYYLANEIKNSKQYITPEAYEWYEKSANQGNFYAMFQLARGDNLCKAMTKCESGSKTPRDWLNKLISTATPFALQGNGEAMEMLYYATGKLEWLEKAAAVNYAPAQRILANYYEDGNGYFIIPGSRKKTINALLKSSAENGNPKAMMSYFAELRAQNSLVEAGHWLEKAAETGYEEAVFNYGYFLAVEPKTVGIDKDIVKGYALISLLKELNGGGDVQTYVDRTLPEILSQMTEDQIVKGDEMAKNWKSSHPPLSFFPEKLGY
ncbi:sel1 repeat family protein [Pseudomonas baltica]|uniref:tetratricopeptide repeat protein n=1 Tax=Pseudomonas baltica TaxID=2762576 RepID=UPI00289A2C5B|nr:sel1 repeat family protein [Pseudomonas baltica]